MTSQCQTAAKNQRKNRHLHGYILMDESRRSEYIQCLARPASKKFGLSADTCRRQHEGRCCPLAKRGHNRDGKKGKLQIVYGLLCAPDGCPVAVEVFEGNTADPKTVATQIDKLKNRFGLARVVLVGDRGMITEARIREDVIPANLDWI